MHISLDSVYHRQSYNNVTPQVHPLSIKSLYDAQRTGMGHVNINCHGDHLYLSLPIGTPDISEDI